jgi:hypothetical protein
MDSKARIAHAQPGGTVGDVDRETQVHGLTAVLGFVSLTGIAGLSLGGGFARLAKVKAAWDPHNMSVRTSTSRPRAAERTSSIPAAAGDDQGDVVVLLVRAEAPDVVDHR